MKSTTPSSQSSGSTGPTPPVDPTTATANRVSVPLPVSIQDSLQRYDGFECIQAPPPDSPDGSSASNNPTEIGPAASDSITVSKLNKSTSPYFDSISSLKHCLGSVRQFSLTLPIHAVCFQTSFKKSNEYPVIIDSGATHHMWNDFNAFLTLVEIKNSDVSLANNFKIPIAGCGTI